MGPHSFKHMISQLLRGQCSLTPPPVYFILLITMGLSEGIGETLVRSRVFQVMVYSLIFSIGIYCQKSKGEPGGGRGLRPN